MIGPNRIEGYAIVSADGMIADAGGKMPDAIRNKADQNFLQAELDRAVAVVHGRHSHEGGPNATRRKRIVLTRQVASLAPDPSHPHSLLWNPAGATFEAAVKATGSGPGTIAIIGGTEVFALFLPLYDAFHLTLAAGARIPSGRPLFPEVGPASTPSDVFARHGLRAGPPRDLDAAAGITLTTWRR
jgi:dihydrofolate reductase